MSRLDAIREHAIFVQVTDGDARTAIGVLQLDLAALLAVAEAAEQLRQIDMRTKGTGEWVTQFYGAVDEVYAALGRLEAAP